MASIAGAVGNIPALYASDVRDPSPVDYIEVKQQIVSPSKIEDINPWICGVCFLFVTTGY